MKIEGVPGTYMFPAAYNYQGMWEITSGAFHSLEEAEQHFKLYVPEVTQALWPVEKLDNGGYYIPAKEELE